MIERQEKEGIRYMARTIGIEHQDFEELLQGRSLQMELDEQIIYDQLSENKNAVWSLLLASEYLRVVKTEYEERTGGWNYLILLTNRKVTVMFE